MASREKLMAALMAPAAWLMAGPLRTAALHHMQVRRHRAASFLLIVALLTSLALYPTVMTAVFDNKTERGARVQLGSDIQVTLNALDLMPAEAQSRGGMRQRDRRPARAARSAGEEAASAAAGGERRHRDRGDRRRPLYAGPRLLGAAGLFDRQAPMAI